MGGNPHKTRRLVWGLFLCYLAVVFILVFYKGWGGGLFLRDNYASLAIWKDSVSSSLNLVPFRFLFDTGGYTARAWVVNVCGNIALFVPMGIFLPVLFSKTRGWGWGRIVLTSVLLIVAIELAQLLLMCGQGDIDDVILNGTGLCIGFACTRLRGVREKLSSL